MEQKGLPTIWFTFSAADNHWRDLSELIYGHKELPNFANEMEYAKWRRKLIRENQHVVDGYFYKRIKLMLDIYFGERGLKIDWVWFRIEYQERGTAHAHGCLRLKNDPGLTDHATKVVKGRVAQRRLKLSNQMVPGVCFQNMDSRDDIWDDGFADEPDERFLEENGLQQQNDQNNVLPQLPDDEVQKLVTDIQEGIKSQEVIIALHDWLLTTVHPNPPEDAQNLPRHESTLYVQKEDNIHPSTYDTRNLHELSPDKRETQYCGLINAVEHHKCQAYCEKKKRKRHQNCNNNENDRNTRQRLETESQDENALIGNCRFQYPYPVPANDIENYRTHVKIVQNKLKKKDADGNEYKIFKYNTELC